MIAGFFSALLPLMLATSLQTPAPAAPSAAPQSCPVHVKVENGAFGQHVHFKNQAEQPITGIVFHSVRVNAVGEEVGPTLQESDTRAAFHIADRSEQTFADRKGLAPNAEKSIANNMGVYGRPEKGDQFLVYVRAVKFADGTVWKDDGSHSCKDN